MKEEIQKVLEMVQAGTISAQEGQKLLDAMGAFDEPAPAMVKGQPMLHLQVNAANQGEARKNATVNIHVPASVARSVIKMGLAMGGEHGQAMEGLNMEEITRMVDEMMLSGQTGDIINVDSDDAKVRIYLE